jgi:EmrB/QacA subfamily drug resistance transporter
VNGIGRREAIILVVCCAALFMSTLDTTVLNVALPTLERNFNASPSGLQWTASTYILVRGSLLFLSGSFSDRFGRRRCFRVGLVVFTTGSIACSLSPSLGLLIAARGFQAVGGALMTPSTLAIIVNTFTEKRSRARAIGFWSATTGISTAAGPLIGGLLIESWGWRSVFWINVPVGVVVYLGTRWLPESRQVGRARPFDLPGQFAMSVTIVALTVALITAPTSSWTAPSIVTLIVISLVGAAAFIARELGAHHPFLQLKIFKVPTMVGAMVVAFVAYIAFAGFLFFNTLYLQDVRGFSPLHAGVWTMPTTAAVLVAAPLSGRLLGGRGARLPAMLGGLLVTAAMGELAIVIAAGTPIWLLFAGYSLLGLGVGFLNPPATGAAVASMSPSRAGVAAATTSTARQFGSNFGVALMGSLVFTVMAAYGTLHSGVQLRDIVGQRPESFISGLRLAYSVVAGLGLISCLIVSWAFDPAKIREPALDFEHHL